MERPPCKLVQRMGGQSFGRQCFHWGPAISADHLSITASITKLIVADDIGAAIRLIEITLAIMDRLVIPDRRVCYTIKINSERGVPVGIITCYYPL